MSRKLTEQKSGIFKMKIRYNKNLLNSFGSYVNIWLGRKKILREILFF
jgi:hypothetical protein